MYHGDCVIGEGECVLFILLFQDWIGWRIEEEIETTTRRTTTNNKTYIHIKCITKTHRTLNAELRVCNIYFGTNKDRSRDDV